MSKNIVTAIINAMLEESLLVERPTRRHDGVSGRQPGGLFVHEELFFTIGVVLTQEHAALALRDASGQLRDCRPLGREGMVLHGHALEEIRQTCDAVLRAVDRSKVLGAGVALPGFVDFANGSVMFSQAFPDSENFNVKDFFREQLGLDSYLINESHVWPLIEKLHGGAAGMDNFATVDNGLGAGFFFNGQLYRGWQLRCGELGRMKITENALVGQDGRTGQLYSLALPGVISEKLCAIMRGGGVLKIDSRRIDARGYIPSDAIADAAAAGDMIVAGLLTEQFSVLGEALVNIAYLLNPQAVFLPHWTARCPECTRDVVRRKLGYYNQQCWKLQTTVESSRCEPTKLPEVVAHLFAEEFLREQSTVRALCAHDETRCI